MKPLDIQFDSGFVKAAAILSGHHVAAKLEDSRAIRVSPFDGAYGFAGAVIAIEGTPLRGIFIAECNSEGTVETLTVISVHGRLRRYRRWQVESLSDQARTKGGTAKWLMGYIGMHLHRNVLPYLQRAKPKVTVVSLRGEARP